MSAKGFVPPPVTSVHAVNNLGETLYQAVLTLKPLKVVEFGVLHGYSSLSMAQALRHLGRGHLRAYDLWDRYPYNHGDRSEVEARIQQAGLAEYVTLCEMDFFDWLREPEEFDLLYVDISNDGRVVRGAVTTLRNQFDDGAVMIFEGGSEARDRVWWMSRFDKEPINPLRDALDFRVLDDRFPSLSIVPRNALSQNS